MDVLLLNAANGESVARIRTALGDLQVQTITSWSALAALLETDPPCTALAVLAAVSSATGDLPLLHEMAARLARRKPLVVVDDDFDVDVGVQLLAVGVEDYLNAAVVNAAELDQRVAWAVVRHGQRHDERASSVADERLRPGPTTLASASGPTELLPPRLRQVLELLLEGRSAKQIARQLGTRPKTIYNQIAVLRCRFGVQSNQQLVIEGLRRRASG